MEIISEKMTRAQLGEKLGMKGAELTMAIKAMKFDGRLIHFKAYKNPSKNGCMGFFYCLTAKTVDMFSNN